MSEAIEKALREAYMSGYADGCRDVLVTVPRLLNDYARLLKTGNVENTEKRSEEWMT